MKILRVVELGTACNIVSNLMRRSLRRGNLMFENVIKTNLKDTWCEEVYWIQWSKDKDQWLFPVNMVMNLCGLFHIRDF
jgi:hypothetical protein